MVAFQFMWELTSSLPVSGYVLKGSTEPSWNPDSPTHQPTHLPLHWREIRKSQLQQLCPLLLILVLNEARLSFLCWTRKVTPLQRNSDTFRAESLCIIPFQFLPHLREEMNLESEGVEICGNFLQQKLKQNGRLIKLREKRNGKFTVAIWRSDKTSCRSGQVNQSISCSLVAISLKCKNYQRWNGQLYMSKTAIKTETPKLLLQSWKRVTFL